MSKDDGTWLDFCYIVFGLLVAYIGYKAIYTVGIQTGWVERFDWFPTLNNVFGVAVGASVAIWIRMSVEKRTFHLAAVNELRKVKWPTLEDTKKMTMIVAVVVAILSVILSVFDIIWSKALQLILP